MESLSNWFLAQSVSGTQEHVGGFIAFFQFSLVVDLGLSKNKKQKRRNYTFGFIPQQGIFFRNFMFQVMRNRRGTPNWAKEGIFSLPKKIK